jgi:CRP-like cAMP-binding protein
MFDELGPDERLAVLRGLKLRTFEPGDVLVTEGEPPSGLYLLTAGGVKVYARDAESRNHPVGRLDEGDFFGEIASRSGLPRNATVVATASNPARMALSSTTNGPSERLMQGKRISSPARLSPST